MKVLGQKKLQLSLRDIDLPKDDPVRRKPKIDLAKNKLSWEPSHELESGLIKTIQYFEKFNEID